MKLFWILAAVFNKYAQRLLRKAKDWRTLHNVNIHVADYLLVAHSLLEFYDIAHYYKNRWPAYSDLPAFPFGFSVEVNALTIKLGIPLSIVDCLTTRSVLFLFRLALSPFKHLYDHMHRQIEILQQKVEMYYNFNQNDFLYTLYQWEPSAGH